MKFKKELILIGGGGHCLSVIDVIEEQGEYTIAGIIDKKEKKGQTVNGYYVTGTDDDLPGLIKNSYWFLVTIGHIRNPDRRIEIFTMLKKSSALLPVIISPRAYVSKTAIVGQGTVVMHMAQVNAGSVTGENCIINSKALLEHGVKVGDHCHISTGAILNGNCTIGDRCFVGSGAICRESIEIPDNSFIKAGSLVTK